MTDFILSVDLGCMGDFTALSVCEIVRPGGPRRELSEEETPKVYHFRHLHRMKRGTTYPEIVALIARMMDSPELRGRTDLVVDQTGVGLPVVQDLRRVGLNPKGIVITAGNEAADGADGSCHVPKSYLVSSVQLVMGYGRLKWAARLEHAELLEGELRDFQMRVTATGRETFNAREGANDDLVLSVAMAVWYGENRMREIFMWVPPGW
ncbi:MAG: hypothetical protein KA419_07170 [Acidobacteria bacterium]|nr:hypothetical protein [Acidobacteriota bacterium]